MMQVATWLSVIVLGPGSVAIFVWFLVELKSGPGRDQDTANCRQ